MSNALPSNTPAPVSATAEQDHIQTPFTREAQRGEGTEFSGDKIPQINEVSEGRVILPNFILDRVFGSRVLVVPDAGDRKKGSIIVPDSAIERPSRGRVAATGEGRVIESGHIVPNNAQPGMHVLYGKYAGTEIELDGYLFVIIQDSDIFLSLTPKEAAGEDSDQPQLVADLPAPAPQSGLLTESTGMKHTRHNDVVSAHKA